MLCSSARQESEAYFTVSEHFLTQLSDKAGVS